jgi:hypothetical protein
MVDISALMRVLPVSALEPDWMASLGGFIDVPKDHGWQERISLLFFDALEPESPECLPLPDFVAWLRDERRRVNRLASDLRSCFRN